MADALSTRTLAEQLESIGQSHEHATGQKLDLISKSNRVDSLVGALTQALNSGDAGLLHQCIDIRDRKLIRNTISRLSVGLLIPLLTALVVKLNSSPRFVCA